MEWRNTIDPATIPDEVIRRERARRNNALRKTFGGGHGRPKILRTCPRCQQTMGTKELKYHKCPAKAA